MWPCVYVIAHKNECGCQFVHVHVCVCGHVYGCMCVYVFGNGKAMATVVHELLRGRFLWSIGRCRTELGKRKGPLSGTALAHSLPTDRKTSRTALLFLRSFLSTAFLASFLSRGSQRVCVWIFVSATLACAPFALGTGWWFWDWLVIGEWLVAGEWLVIGDWLALRGGGGLGHASWLGSG